MNPAASITARSETIRADLRQVLRSLKLSAICDTLPERVALATSSHLAYQEFLTVVLADEVERRDRAGAASRARAARLDATMVLEAWDDSTESVFDRLLWSELTTLRFVDDVRVRKLTIANGQGTVHNVSYDLEQQFGIGLTNFTG